MQEGLLNPRSTSGYKFKIISEKDKLMDSNLQVERESRQNDMMSEAKDSTVFKPTSAVLLIDSSSIEGIQQNQQNPEQFKAIQIVISSREVLRKIDSVGLHLGQHT